MDAPSTRHLVAGRSMLATALVCAALVDLTAGAAAGYAGDHGGGPAPQKASRPAPTQLICRSGLG
jgi:hypothetical protein